MGWDGGRLPRTEFRVTRGVLSAAQMAAAEAWLLRAGWRSAARAAAEAFAAASADGAGPMAAPQLRARDTVAGGIYFAAVNGRGPLPAPPSGTGVPLGDGGEGSSAPPAEWFYAMAKTPGPRREPELEVGVIGATSSSAPAEPGRTGPPPLRVWLAAWAAALAAAAPGIEVRWHDPARPIRLAPLLASGTYARPRVRLAELDQAAVWTEPEARQWLDRLRRAGTLPRAELAAESPAARAQLRRLAAAGLARSVQAPGPVAYAATAPAAAAADWPRLWLTERLSMLGCTAIAWPANARPRSGPAAQLTPPAGEGMPPHVAADFCGRLWCLVCTPGEWDAAAARAWEQERARWKWDAVLVLALGGITAPLPDAARTAPDLESGADLLATAFATAAQDYAAQRLAPLEQAYGWPLAAMLARRFGR